MNEFDRIRKISRAIGRPSERVTIGIGDDTAVLKMPTAKNLLFCSDAMVEEVHFDLNLSSAFDVGYKATSSCLSDIAAMNGEPLFALFSLALPKSISEDFLENFYAAATQVAKQYKVEIVGGDLTSSPSGVFIDVSLIGQAIRPIARSGAKAGDLLVVSGFPGASRAGLEALKLRRGESYQELVQAHLRPTPRFDLLTLMDACATSMIDLSDGLSSEIYHLAEASKVGFDVEARAIPLHPKAIKLARSLKQSPYDWAMSGGEDYELVATLDPERVPQKLPAEVTVIGVATNDSGNVTEIIDSKRRTLVRSGYDHFASS